MFKIVQTIENGLKQLTVVPSAWVNNKNQLSWPKIGADKLIRKANSVPEANWFTMPCKLKRSHLINYQIAEEELERMLNNDDTTDQEAAPAFVQPKKRPRVILPKIKPNPIDFNSLAEECLEEPLRKYVNLPTVETEMNVPKNKRPRVILPKIKPNPIDFNSLAEEDLDEPLRESVESSTVEAEMIEQPMLSTENITYEFLPTITSSLDPQVNTKIDKIIANQEIIIQNQQVIIDLIQLSGKDNQTNIMQQLAKQEVMLDSMASKTINDACSCKTVNQSSLLTTKDDIFFDPIDNLPDLEKLESKLAHKNDMDEYIQKFSYVCGRKGSGNGVSNCYILVDKIFSRKFMTLCSWAGGARDGKEKIPFKIFKNIITLFFRVVRLSDDEFTLKHCEEFFKAVIRNSKKRNESTLSRSSRSKRRPGSLSYKTRKEKNEVQQQHVNVEDLVDDTENEKACHEETTQGSNSSNVPEGYEAESENSSDEENPKETIE